MAYDLLQMYFQLNTKTQKTCELKSDVDMPSNTYILII